MATISRPDPTDYQDAPWTDQNGQRWLADSKGRWSIYVDPPEAGGGASAFADLTDKATADIPTINTPLSTALGLKLSTATAASTYAPISTTVTLSGTQTIDGIKTFLNLAYFGSDVTITGGITSTAGDVVVQNGSVTANDGFIGSGANLTSLPSAELTGNVAAARIAAAAAGGTLPFSGTTGTFSGAVTVAATTLASNSTTGAVLIGNGSASTNVAIGGGTVYAGNRLVFTSSLNDASGRFGIAEGTGHSTLTAYNSLTLLTTVGSGRLKVENSLTTITGNLSVTADVILAKTITAPATTGARTINQTSGRVNFAAAATSLVVTNSLCTANSIIHCTVATNDTTMRGALAVAGAGSFTIYADTAPTAETAVNFILTN